MNTPTDQNTPTLAEGLIQTLDELSGLHPGHRPAHAKGMLFAGTFTPSVEAASLTRAPHIERETTPVTVRFSNSTGIPTIPDNDPNAASPRGMAIRFHLAEHVHTDIIAHSHNGFPVRTPEEFLEFLRAVVASKEAKSSPTPIEAFLADHPKALLFVQTPKPIPTSFAGEAYFGVNAFQFTNKDGDTRFGRYRILPEHEGEHLDNETAATKTGNFLFDELAERVAQGPVQYQVAVQLAEDGDITDDATSIWAEDRPQLTLGTVTITAKLPDDPEQLRIIFDPIPRVAGIDPSGDPLLETRADVYLRSGRRRRAAAEKTQ
jgi:catalase